MSLDNIKRSDSAEKNTTTNTSRRRNMAAAFILLSVLLGAGVSYAVLDVAVDSNIVANIGDTVKLKCVLQGVEGLVDIKKLMVQWYTRGKQIAEFDDKIQIAKTGLSMSLEGLMKGDATLTIQSFTAEDAGNYRCYFYYKSDHIMKQTVLSANVTSTQSESDVELSTCDTVLDKKLDKIIDWISKVESKLVEVQSSCSSQKYKTREN
ncbi:uncharacterized protein [Dendrobates tinctorius]|uniref:uncharacterized protein n=1 Tax=Dendrobates tinctorius TaxID=92724 RepID=UPI003CC9C056